MNLRTLFIIYFVLLLLPEVVSADVVFPITFAVLPFFPIIILVELLVFAAYYDFILKNKGVDLSFGNILLGVFAANLVSSAVGLIFPAHKEVTILLFSAFLTSVFVEFLVYTAFFRIGKLELLKISFLTNLASYSFIVGYMSLISHTI